MANKIVVMFLMCLVLGEISYIEAHVVPKKRSHVTPIARGFITLVNCIKPYPRHDEQKLSECELRCDKGCSLKEHRRAKEREGKQKVKEEEEVHVPKPGPVTRVYVVCYNECSSECPIDDVKCLNKCDKICTKVSEHESKWNMLIKYACSYAFKKWFTNRLKCVPKQEISGDFYWSLIEETLMFQLFLFSLC